MARKHNVTGIPRLSIGSTKNDRGYELKRYVINATGAEGQQISKSFYYGVNCKQYDAFMSACDLLREIGEDLPGKMKLKKLYEEYNHESLA